MQSRYSALSDQSRGPHVLYITPIFGYPPIGGPRLRTYNTVRALARCADVSLYLTDVPDAPDSQLARRHMLSMCRSVQWPEPPVAPRGSMQRLKGAAKRLLPAAVQAPLRQGASWLRFALRGRGVDVPPADPSVQLEPLAEWICANQVDVVWLGFGGISYHLAPLKEMTGRKLVIETESVWSRFLLRSLPFEGDPKRRLEIEQRGREKENEERWGTNYADVTTAVSKVDADYFQALTPTPERVMLLANVIDVDAYARRENEGSVKLKTPAICFPGTFSHGTGNIDAAIWLLDEVMPLAWRHMPDLQVYLVGKDPAPVLQARRSQRVHVTGEVEDVAPYLRGSVAVVVPLRWESGTRFKILEAFACGTPVVSTTLGAEGLDVESGQHLLLADDAAAFAEGVVALAREPSQRQRLAGQAGELVRRDYDLPAAERQARAVLAQLGFAKETGDTVSASGERS